MKAIKNEDYYEIESVDVGQASLYAFGKRWLVLDFMDEVQTQDVGKRVYCEDGLLQVENNEQFQRRTHEHENMLEVMITLRIRACVEESNVMRKVNSLICAATTGPEPITSEWTKVERWTIERC